MQGCNRSSIYLKIKPKQVLSEKPVQIYKCHFTFFQAISTHHIEGQWTRWNLLLCYCWSRYVPAAHIFHEVSKWTTVMWILVCTCAYMFTRTDNVMLFVSFIYRPSFNFTILVQTAFFKKKLLHLFCDRKKTNKSVHICVP